MPDDRDPELPDSVDDDPRREDPDPDVWTGRAGVRPYGAVPRDPYEGESDWADPDAVEPAGRWWTPIAVGTVSLLLLALLGIGVVVIVQNSGGETTSPEATPATVGITTEPAPPPTVPTGTVTATPTTEPADAEVTVPALRGMPLVDAQAALSRTGLAWRVLRRESDAEPDTVIDCDPAEGQQVPSDTRVTLIVAAAPAGTPTQPTTAPSVGASG